MEAQAENLMTDVAMDLKRALKRAMAATALDTRAELVNNVYPLIEQALIAIDERFQRNESALDEHNEATAKRGAEQVSPFVAGD